MLTDPDSIAIPKSVPSRAPAHAQAWAEEFSSLSSLLKLPTAVVRALSMGHEALALRLAIVFGQRDEKKLTNMVFFARHPKRQGRKLQRGEPGFQRLSREWLRIRDQLVRPALATRTLMPAPGSAIGSTTVIVRPVNPKKPNSLERGVGVRATVRFKPDLQDPRDIALGVTAAAEGGFDTVNIYDRGIISWGIMQWTAHQGSLQNALAFIKRRLKEMRQSDLWPTVFPDLDVRQKPRSRDHVFVFRGTPVTTQVDLRRLFRGQAERGQLESTTISKWARIFALAGRNPIIQQLQREYARQEVDRALQRDLGNLFKSRHYGRVRDYVGGDKKAVALFFGMWTNNPKASYEHLRRTVDRLAQRYGTPEIARWPSGWQATLTVEFERILRASRFGAWGDDKARSLGRSQSRTAKILDAYRNITGRR